MIAMLGIMGCIFIGGTTGLVVGVGLASTAIGAGISGVIGYYNNKNAREMAEEAAQDQAKAIQKSENKAKAMQLIQQNQADYATQKTRQSVASAAVLNEILADHNLKKANKMRVENNITQVKKSYNYGNPKT